MVQEYTRVSSISIRGFRGIKSIEKNLIEGFKGINIFVGRNNSGKSTIIEAIYLATTLEKHDILDRIPLEYVIKRRGWYGISVLQDIVYKKMDKASITAHYIDGSKISLEIALYKKDTIEYRIFSQRATSTLRLSFNSKGRTSGLIGVKEGRSNTVFIDWNLVSRFGLPEKVYSLLLEYGGKDAEEYLAKVFKTLYKGFEEFKTLKKGDQWVLSAIFTKYSIPIYLLGDGLRYTFSYIALLGSIENGVVVAEEPELHQHIGSLELLSEAIVKSFIERKNQLFITTHSLEFIDLMLERAKKYGAGQEFTVYRVYLKEGLLGYRRYSFKDALELRKELELDLRF